ncbi:integrase arm-type DNA-binding domain-containing protein [Sodalis endosymbiont of Spalangia cameroni]|uniref:tyrosine-type recombinase/integrase n=1 Tax=Sodalis praecaptivus TaxID=1239307 RepID=UPI0031F8C5FA
MTDLQIKTWIKSDERFEGRADGGGLYIRYRANDKKPSWRFRYRISGKGRVVYIGSYPTVSLSKAREIARELSARVALGFDVAGEKQERKSAFLEKLAEKENEKTVTDVVNMFYTKIIMPRQKRYTLILAYMNKHVIPNIGTLKIKNVTPVHIDEMIKSIAASGSPASANKVLSLIKRMFNYAIRNRYIESNPAIAFSSADAGGQEKSRKRWLSTDELCLLFKTMRYSQGFNRQNELAIKLLLALCCRKMELCAAKWSEFDFENTIWSLPENRSKTSESIDIPLSSIVIKWLHELKVFSCNSPWILPARLMSDSKNPHIAENTLNLALSKIRADMPPDVPPFTVHDFRRTARTHLAALGIDPIVAERCLNHTIKGIEGIYNRHQYLNERRIALDKWSELLVSLENG